MFGRKVLIRRPSARLADGLVTHIERQPVDVELAQRQWQAYVDTLFREGWQPVEAPRVDDCPDGVFIEDAVVVYGHVAVITRPGALERRPETDGLAELLGPLGYEIRRIEAPGTLDGGDVLKWGGTLWVGQGGRSNAEGLAQLASHLQPFGIEAYGVKVSKVLHLKSAVTALPDGTVIGYEPLVDDPDRWGGHFLAVPEEPGAHVVVLDGESVLMASSAPESAALLRGRGLRVVTVDISEYEKLEGCVTCLSVRLRGPWV